MFHLICAIYLNLGFDYALYNDEHDDAQQRMISELRKILTP